MTPQVKAHLSVILALMALVKTAQYYYARFQLNFSTRGVVEGASKTDVAAQLPALNLLMVISVVAAGAVRLEHLAARLGAARSSRSGLWAFVSLVIGTIVPVVYQQFFVQPNELAEGDARTSSATSTRPATRSTCDKVAVRELPVQGEPHRAVDRRTTRRRSRTRACGTRRSSCATTSSSRALQTFYKFADADVDRYVIDGKLVQMLISARELNPRRPAAARAG